MNYRELLVKYMRHVVNREGADFTDWLNGFPGSDVIFDDEEVQELTRISAEIEAQE